MRCSAACIWPSRGDERASWKRSSAQSGAKVNVCRAQRNDEGLACYRRMPRDTLASWLFKNENCMRLTRFWALGKAAMARVRDRVSRNVWAGPSGPFADSE